MLGGKNLPPDKLDLTGNETGPHRDAMMRSSAHHSQPESEELANLNENQLKNLLEEAVSYRTPKDKEQKSDMFKALLEKTEEEDEDRSRLWTQCKIQSHKLSSLQNLTELNDHNDYRKHHNSRHSQKKYLSSSVSSRQREGGSLPSNVDHVDQTVPLFKNFKRQQSQQQGNDTSKFGGGIGHYYNKSESHSYTDRDRELAKFDDETKHLLADDALAQGYESGHLDNCCNQGTEMKKIPRLPTIYNTQNNEIKIIDQQSKLRSLSPDRTIIAQQYGSGDQHGTAIAGSSKTTLLEATPFPLQNSNSVNSVITQSSQLHFPGSMPPKIDENANLPTTSGTHNSIGQPSGPGGKKPKNKVHKSERNIRVVEQEKIEGYCGDKDIYELLNFIEEANNAKALLEADKSRKKEKASGGGAVKEKKESSKKLKKYSSLEELSTLSKKEQQQQQEAVNEMHSHNDTSAVSLRATTKQLSNTSGGKKNMPATTESVLAAKEKEKKEKLVAPVVVPSKRHERRSWGTEELDYYVKGTAAESVSIVGVDDLETEVRMTTTPITATNEKKEKKKAQSQQNELTLTKKKDSASILSIESISNSSETAEFHLVTNKKKTKKKSSVSQDDNVQDADKRLLFRQQQPYVNYRRDGTTTSSHYTTNNSSSASSTGSNNRNKYPYTTNSSSAFVNDRDIYMNHHGHVHQQDKNNNHHHHHRRKSTSSVPPSDKSDSSDVDSVHSLPIGSTTSTKLSVKSTNTTQQTSSSGGSTPQAASYADMAKILNNNNNVNANNNNNSSGSNSSGNSNNGNSVVGDNWPTITSATTITTSAKPFGEQQPIDGVNYTAGLTSASNVLAGKNPQPQNVRTIKCQQMSFPELVDNKNIININNSSNSDNIIIINNKNTSSNSQNTTNSNSNKAHTVTVAPVKPSYSQSLADDKKSTSDQQVSLTNDTTITATIVTKNVLQKSKSVEHGFYSIEQYPALENTVVPLTNVTTVKPQKAVVSDSVTSANIKTSKLMVTPQQSANKQLEKLNNKNIEVSRKVKQGVNEETTIVIGSNLAGKKSKKEKLSAFQNPSDNSHHSFSSSVDNTGCIAPATTPASANRPAVIILNDTEPKAKSEFTFGFDIDRALLFGDFDEDEIEFMDTSSEPNELDVTSPPQQTQQNYCSSPKPKHIIYNNTPNTNQHNENSLTNNISNSGIVTATIMPPINTTQLEISNVSHVSTQSDLGYASSTSPKQQSQQQLSPNSQPINELLHDNSIIAISNSSQPVITNIADTTNISSSNSSHMKSNSTSKRKSLDQQRQPLSMPPPPTGIVEHLPMVGINHVLVNSHGNESQPHLNIRYCQPPPPIQQQYMQQQHIVMPVVMTMVPPPHIPPPAIIQTLPPTSIVLPAAPPPLLPPTSMAPPPIVTSAPSSTLIDYSKLINFDEWKLRYVPPQYQITELISNNHDRIVEFIGCDWDKVISGHTGNVEFYDGK